MSKNTRISIDKAARLVWVQYAPGCEVSLGDWIAMMHAIFADPDYEPGFSFIYDRSLVEAAPEKSYIEGLADFIRTNHDKYGNARIALVVTGIPVYGMARMLQGLANETEKMQVFKNIDAARKWLRAP